MAAERAAHSAGSIGARVKTSRSDWYQGCNMTYHLQKQVERPLDRKIGENAIGGVNYRSITVHRDYIGFRKTIPFQVITSVIHYLTDLTAIKVAHRTPESP